MLTSQTEWAALKSEIQQIGKVIENQSGSVGGPNFSPPRDATEIAEFESLTGLILPEDFSNFLTEFCGGWEFSWSLTGDSEIDFADDLFSPLGGGNDQGQFVGQSKYTLLILYESLVEAVGEWFEHGGVDESDYQIVKNCFPLYMCSYGSNFVAMRLDSPTNEIVFLDHDAGFQVTTNHIIGRGFTQFLNAFSRLGCPNLDHTLPIYNENREIDMMLPAVQKWLVLLDN